MKEVEFVEVVKKYGDLVAVNNLNLKVNDGELLAILGAPGAGKSSTLKMVAGVEDITSGVIKIGGQVVNDLDPSERDVAMAFETYALYPHISVFENIAFPLRSPKRAKYFTEKDIKKRVQEVAEFLEIDMLLNRKPKELSGGQRQRVSLARCLIRDPKVFLLDEPIAHLDAKLRHKLRRELKIWQQRKKTTMLYTTTDYLEAFSVGDRIAVLHRGSLLQVGAWDEIYERPAHRFIGQLVSDPPMNFFQGQLVRNGGAILFETKGIRFALSPEIQKRLMERSFEEVILGVFPSKVLLEFSDFRMEEHTGTLVKAVVRFSEVRGSRKIVFAQTGEGVTFTAQAALGIQCPPGSEREFFFPAASLQVFDNITQRNVLLLD
ncbi:MAG: multiple sugar transport system ATP-binding protein [Candidatus Atribacteria bacterium]|nr:multiple sugar transport system ATP-binding protein [Candidatus Atribacteria bacterium]